MRVRVDAGHRAVAAITDPYRTCAVRQAVRALPDRDLVAETAVCVEDADTVSGRRRRARTRPMSNNDGGHRADRGQRGEGSPADNPAPGRATPAAGVRPRRRYGSVHDTAS